MNTYSRLWFDTFLRGMDDRRTRREVEFLVRHLPVDRFRKILDVCCGTGRHLRALVPLGYEVVGLDRDAEALAEVRRGLDGDAVLVRSDMRRLDQVPGRFDAVICMWQSFGYFDRSENLDVLRGMRRRLHPGGRVVLDVFDRIFFDRMQGERRIERNDEVIWETLSIAGNRLKVSLEYESHGVMEEFDWEIYAAAELITLAGECGLVLVEQAAGFKDGRAPEGEEARMQLVFRRTDP